METETEGDGPQSIIIDECLCFITNKYSYVDIETVIKLCVEFFDESEIEASKDLLFNILHNLHTNTAFRRCSFVNKSDSKNV